MPTEKRLHQSYVQLFIPTRDRHGRKLPTRTVRTWQDRAESFFQRYVEGYYVSPLYRAEGGYRSSDRRWIKESIYILKTYAPAADCRKLLRALEREFIADMGTAMAQESIAVESSLEGLATYRIE